MQPINYNILLGVLLLLIHHSYSFFPSSFDQTLNPLPGVYRAIKQTHVDSIMSVYVYFTHHILKIFDWKKTKKIYEINIVIYNLNTFSLCYITRWRCKLDLSELNICKLNDKQTRIIVIIF